MLSFGFLLIVEVFCFFNWGKKKKFLPVLFQQGAEGVGLFDSGDDANEVICQSFWGRGVSLCMLCLCICVDVIVSRNFRLKLVQK